MSSSQQPTYATPLAGRVLPIPHLIALDLDGTLLNPDGRVSERNRAALHNARAAGAEIVICTGRRHTYAMRVLDDVGLPPTTAIVSSNGAVVRQIDATLIERTLMQRETAEWLVAQIDEFRNALVITFDRVKDDGSDERGALVVETLEDLHASIGRWMETNAPWIERTEPIQSSFATDLPIQMMLCGTVERMRRAEAVLLAHESIADADGIPGTRAIIPAAHHTGGVALHGISLHRTEYPDKDLSLVDLLPAGVSKGRTLLRLAARHGMAADEILAIGDNWNDLPMLAVAGRGVLMGNAPHDLLPLASERGWTVAPGNDQDGVAQTIDAAMQHGTTA
jgi:HAD superfamily hydrolase (TIGR01484 family)